MRRSERIGFTLIELLVVLAVISVLAALLFPVFASVRERARQTVCMSNMKQIGLAEVAYLQDYDEVFWSTPEPGGELDPPGTEDGCTQPACAGTTFWSDILMPYIKNTQVFSCPSNSDQLYQPDSYTYPANPPGSATSWTSPTAYRVTYGFADFGPHADTANLWTLSELDSTSQIALFSDAIYAWNYPSCQQDPDKAAGTGSYYFTEGSGYFSVYGLPRHSGGMNFAYADGHAKFGMPVGPSVPPGAYWLMGYYPNARISDQDCTGFEE